MVSRLRTYFAERRRRSIEQQTQQAVHRAAIDPRREP